MKQLLIFPWIHHSVMMTTLARFLKQNGVEADLLCIDQYQFFDNSKVDYESRFILNLGRSLKKIHPFSLQEKLVYVFERYVMRRFLRKYDKLDFHSYKNYYNDLIANCINNHIKYDITVWGSDVMRASIEDFEIRKKGYENSICIKGFDKLLDILSDKYNKKFDNKFIPAYLGNDNFPIIDSVADSECLEVSKELDITKDNKITVICGYNGSPSQQHGIIIDALDQLSEEEKQNIHVVIPMTYDKDNKYTDEISEKINKTGVSHTFIFKFLTERELAVLRMQSQIMIDVQTTDSFNGAIRETLYCENVTLIADWLEYPPYDKNNVYYIKINESNLGSILSDVINNYQTYKDKCVGNKEKLRQLVSWEYCIEPWIKAAYIGL